MKGKKNCGESVSLRPAVKNVLDNDGDLSIVRSKKNADSGYWDYAKGFTYTAAGAVGSMQLGNGRWESTAFNSRLQPTKIALGTIQNGTDKLKLNFTYNTAEQNDNNGNVLSQTITVPTETRNDQTYAAFMAVQTYTYDSLNRIKDAKEMIGATQQWKQTFDYDRYGNRRFDTANNATTTLAPGCPTAVCNPTIDPSTNKLIGYSFDNAGNTKLDAENREFIYDGENKQVEVKNQNGATVGKYFYNGDGQRVKKLTATESTVFVYNATGQLVAEYATQIAQPQEANVSYLTNDHLGSPRIITDANGQVISRRDFQPFGEEIARAGYGSDDVVQKFTGYERDNESELDFAEARYFNSGFGRFSSPDDFLNDTHVSGPQSWNLYAYVRNNPLKYVDNTGEELQIIRIKDKEGNVVDSVAGENRGVLLGWLNHTYGCDSCVSIDKNGTIRLDKSLVSKEVLAVTKDLTDAIEDKTNVIGILGMEGADNVRFAQGQQSSITDANGKKRDFIAIDFKDFRQLSGDKDAVSSFTNYAFVHEVLHFYPYAQQDTLTENDRTGPVENRVNEIRYVRGDLLRSSYEALTDGDISTASFGSAKIDGKTKKIKRNENDGIIAESKKIVRWNKRMISNK